MKSRAVVLQAIVVVLLGIGLGVLYLTQKTEIQKRQAVVHMLESRAGQLEELTAVFERLKKQQENLLKRKKELDEVERAPDPAYLFATTRWIDPGRILVTDWEAAEGKQKIQGEAISNREVARLISGRPRTRLAKVISRDHPMPIKFQIEIDPPAPKAARP